MVEFLSGGVFIKSEERFISTLFAILSCFSTNLNASEKSIDKNQVKNNLKSSDSKFNKNSLIFPGGLIVAGVAMGITKVFIIKDAYECRFKEIKSTENYIEKNYIEIMKPYVHVDRSSIYWASAYEKNSSWEPEWDMEVNAFLKCELAMSKYLLDEAGIETGNDKALFPFTLLRILKLDNVLQDLRDQHYNKVYISFSDETSGYEIRVCDGSVLPCGRLSRTCWAINDFDTWNQGSEGGVPPAFYVNILEKCKQAFSKKFFRCFKHHFGGIEITITKDGTFCFEVPDLNAYHNNHTVKKLKMNFNLNKK